MQKGPGAEQIHSVGFPVRDLANRLDSTNAFTDTAAIMMSLRLVVTSDTAIAHLAGALGVPVWVVLPLIPDLALAAEPFGKPLVSSRCGYFDRKKLGIGKKSWNVSPSKSDLRIRSPERYNVRD